MKEILFLFGELNDDDLDWMITVGSIERIAANTILIRQGEAVEALYLILAGKVSVFLRVLDNIKELAILENGEVFGEMSFLDHRLSSATVETQEESLILSLPRTILTQQLQRDVGFAARFYHAVSLIMTTRLRKTDQEIAKNDFSADGINEDGYPLAPSDNFSFARTRFDWLLRRVKSLSENERFS